MSHFSEVKTKMTETKYLKDALKALGFNLVESEIPVQVRGFFGESVQAEFKVTTSTHYDIGFVKGENGSYEVVGDWELLPQVSQIEREPFLAAVKRQYAKTAIEAIAKSQGYEISMVEDEENQTTEMVVTQW